MKKTNNIKKRRPYKRKPIYSLPPFKVESVVSTLSQTIDWGLKQLNVPKIWKEIQGEGITVMVIDTGYTNHIDLQGCLIRDKCENFTSDTNMVDNQGHSTFCCGIIGARDNNIGIVGVAPKCKIITCKSLDDSGSGSYKWVNDALEYAIKIKPDIVSMSLGGPVGNNKQHELIKTLYNMNIPVICAAGNEGGADTATNNVNYPAKYPETIAVAAYDKNGNIANFSSWGNEVDISAPGVDIYSTYLNNKYVKMSGTSFSCPFVAGVVALLLSKHKKQEKEGKYNNCKTVDEIKEHIFRHSTGKGIVGKDPSWGVGVINPVKIILDVSNIDDSYLKS